MHPVYQFLSITAKFSVSPVVGVMNFSRSLSTDLWVPMLEKIVLGVPPMIPFPELLSIPNKLMKVQVPPMGFI